MSLYGWLGEGKDIGQYGWMDGWMEGWMDGRRGKEGKINGLMDEQMDG